MARLFGVLAASLLAALASSCSDVECGEGTIDDNGTCRVADGQRPDNTDICGVGTEYDDAVGGCVPSLPPTVCGPNTNPVTNEEGVTVCEGTGSADGCDTEITCPAPTGGKVSVCGRLINIEDNSPLAAAGATGAPCTTPTATGPCSLKVEFYDPLNFAARPTDTPPQTADAIVWDDCGRFRGQNIVRPFNGFLAVAVDDVNNALADNRRLTGVAFPILANARRVSTRAASTATSTDVAWTTSAGAPYGASSLVDKGVYMPVFFDGIPGGAGTPVVGVVITFGGDGEVAEDNNETTRDFYFSDTAMFTRSTIAPTQQVTGPNGAGLLVGSPLTDHSGRGSERDACKWPSNLAAAIGGVVFFREEVMETEQGTPCP